MSSKLNSAKDPGELHCQGPEQFRSRFQAALDAAEEVDVEALAKDRPAGLNPRLPEICLNSMVLDSLTKEAVAALQKANDPPVVFVRGGKLCRVARDEHKRARIDLLDKPKLRLRMAESALFKIETEDFIKFVVPPDNLVECVRSLPEWPFPGLEALSTAPILRPDGTICQELGYDRDTRVCYIPDPGLEIPPIPEAPTKGQLQEAVNALLDPLTEFPFDSDASRANALALLLSVLMRSVIGGCVPLCIVTAPIQGTGKSLLASVLGIITVGTLAAQTAPSRQNEEEWRKRITALLLDGSQMVLLDNFQETQVLESANLAAVVTSNEWKDRRLGKSEILTLPARAVWVVTGNNTRVGGDLPRRSYTVRLDANAERPWQRSGFRHPDILSYVRQNRGRLLAATFTVIRSWYHAGKPKATGVPAFGSFEEWAGTIGGVLAHAGIEGFLGNLDELRAVQDEEATQWRAFFRVWWQELGEQPTTVFDLCGSLFALDSDFSTADYLPDALLAARDKGENSLRRSMGKALSRLAGRIFECHKLEAAGKDGHTKSRRWRLRDVPSCGVSGESGVCSTSFARTGEKSDASCTRSHVKEGQTDPAKAANPATASAPSLHGGKGKPAEAVPACVREQGHAGLWRLKPGGQWTCVTCEPPGSRYFPTQIEHGRWDSEMKQVISVDAETTANGEHLDQTEDGP